MIDFFVVGISMQLLVPYISRLLRGSLPRSIRGRVRRAMLSFPKIDRPRRLHAHEVNGCCTVRLRIHVSKGVALRRTRDATATVRGGLGRVFKGKARMNVRIRPAGWLSFSRGFVRDVLVAKTDKFVNDFVIRRTLGHEFNI